MKKFDNNQTLLKKMYKIILTPISLFDMAENQSP